MDRNLGDDAAVAVAMKSGIDRKLVLIMAGATGLSVANNYFAQPLLPVIERDLHMSAGVAGLVVTISQVGYALGLIFLLPLGDLLERRKLTATMSLLLAAALGLFAIAPDTIVALIAALLVGSVSVLAQILVPFAASLADDSERGRVVGTVMSGLLLGILLARTIAGWVTDLGGWRVVYAVAAIAALGQAATLWRQLPNSRVTTGLTYPKLLQGVVQLVRDEPVLRRRALLGGLGFGAFSVLWTSIAFLLSKPPYGYGSGVIGTFGLVGAAGALAATNVGRLVDRGFDRWTTVIGSAMLAVCWLAVDAGSHSLVLLISGIIVLDLAVQGVHITNQSLIFALAPEARSRINSAYMTTYFIGGAIGSATSAWLYGSHGWTGVCWLGAGFGVAQLLTAGYAVIRDPRRQPVQTADVGTPEAITSGHR